MPSLLHFGGGISPILQSVQGSISFMHAQNNLGKILELDSELNLPNHPSHTVGL